MSDCAKVIVFSITNRKVLRINDDVLNEYRKWFFKCGQNLMESISVCKVEIQLNVLYFALLN